MRGFFVLLAGIFMMLSAIAHGGFGWPPLRGRLSSAGVGEDLVGALAAGWFFGSAAMAAFGAVVLTSGLRLRRGDLSGVFAVLWIGG